MAKKKTAKDYENLGRVVSSIFETGYLDKKLAYKTSFFKGVLSGFGGVLGATVLIAVLIWVLSWFGSVPLIGHFVHNVEYTVQKSRN